MRGPFRIHPRRRPLVLVAPVALVLLAVSAFAGLQLAAGGDVRARGSSDDPAAVARTVASPTAGVCKNVKQAFATHAYFASSSTAFVDIPGAATTFTVGGTTATCLIVTYTVTAEGDGAAGNVRATLDGAPAGNPVQSLVAYFDPWHSAQATFVLTGVAPGKHTLQMQLSSSSGNLVEIVAGTLVTGFR